MAGHVETIYQPTLEFLQCQIRVGVSVDVGNLQIELTRHQLILSCFSITATAVVINQVDSFVAANLSGNYYICQGLADLVNVAGGNRQVYCIHI